MRHFVLSGFVAALALGGSAFAQSKIENVPVPKVKPGLEASATQMADAATPKTAMNASKIAAVQGIDKEVMTALKIELDGNFAQGGMVIGRAPLGTKIFLDGARVPTAPDGQFVIGFHRDHGPVATVAAEFEGGDRQEETLQIASRNWKIERITLPEGQPVKPNEFSAEDLKIIKASTAKKKEARAIRTSEPYWQSGFDWPVTGRISGNFGSQRIYNGTPRRFHSGVDVARPAGTPILAPADGVITLADTDMFFEGGLVLMQHGQRLESAFMHMSKIDVAAGDIVKKGDKIGEVGKTGRATGNHLHWSLKWRDRLLDPETVVPEMP